MKVGQFLRQCVSIAFAGSLLGLLINRVSPHGVDLRRPVYAAAESGTGSCVGPGAARISSAVAAGMCSDCTVAFVDARTSSAFALGHVSGAFHLPPMGIPMRRARCENCPARRP